MCHCPPLLHMLKWSNNHVEYIELTEYKVTVSAMAAILFTTYSALITPLLSACLLALLHLSVIVTANLRELSHTFQLI